MDRCQMKMFFKFIDMLTLTHTTPNVTTPGVQVAPKPTCTILCNEISSVRHLSLF